MTAAPRGFWLVTALYQAFTLSDGALRMLVLLHLGGQGRAPLALALLLLPYELAGVVTNLLGGWLGARFGLKSTLLAGLLLQALACAMLATAPAGQTLAWFAMAQCLSGVAKDLAKTSAKSYVRKLAPADGSVGPLFRLVAWLTGGKNAVKGGGYFVGGALLAAVGFRATNAALAALLTVAATAAWLRLPAVAGKPATRLVAVVRQPVAVRWLAVSRTFLFGARDVWFAVALPLVLGTAMGLPPTAVGGALAAWVVVYGGVQAMTPTLTGARTTNHAVWLAAGATALLAVVAGALATPPAATAPAWVAAAGILAFGVLFAVVSSLHSGLVVAIAGADDVAERVGFYYAANSLGRLGGTLASGWLYGLAAQPAAGLQSCLATAAVAALVGALTLLPVRRAA
jgi:predicted MFS family arabinose efflux permease